MSTPKTALICGISGQDGAYLAKLLLEKGYKVYGTSRDANISRFSSLERLGILNQITTLSMAPNDFRSVLGTLRQCKADEIYNLAGQSSVGLSFDQPAETIESFVFGTLNLLEAIRFNDWPCRFYNAGSSESFGDTGGHPATEYTPFRPRSPYGVAKASAFHLVQNYRETYGLFACSGILFNHESPLRPPRFVTQKIVRSAYQIAQGELERLHLGNIDIERDWGWAPEYVEAMQAMLNTEQPDDFVIATGHSVPLTYFVEQAFSYFGLKWQNHVDSETNLQRPSDIKIGRADPSKARQVLGWQARTRIETVVKNMCAEFGAPR
jgi:GDPmannose 4,6-dehydratase